VLLETTYCNDNSAWACNELAIRYATGSATYKDEVHALALFSKSCELRFQPACKSLIRPALTHDEPRALDLRLLLREGGKNLMLMPEQDLYTKACKHGWSFACDRSGSARR